jgi:hypothetical protein
VQKESIFAETAAQLWVMNQYRQRFNQKNRFHKWNNPHTVRSESKKPNSQKERPLRPLFLSLPSLVFARLMDGSPVLILMRT